VKAKTRRWSGRLLLLSGSLFLALLAGELVLRLWPQPKRPTIWPPHYRTTYRPQPAIMPGVEGDAHIVINADGLRGDPPNAEAQYRILALGGSTTECLYLDQSEAWPQRLQDMLCTATAQAVWVGNGGRSGHTTREHVLQARTLLTRPPRVDALLLLAGINDLGLRLQQDNGYDPAFAQTPGGQEQLLPRAFDALPNQSSGPSVLWTYLRRHRLLYLCNGVIFRLATIGTGTRSPVHGQRLFPFN